MVLRSDTTMAIIFSHSICRGTISTMSVCIPDLFKLILYQWSEFPYLSFSLVLKYS